jgi:hypothetical protein
VKAALGCVELVHEAGIANRNGQPDFLEHFADQGIGQRRAHLGPSARRAPERGLRPGEGVDQQDGTVLDDHGAGGEAGAGHGGS